MFNSISLCWTYHHWNIFNWIINNSKIVCYIWFKNLLPFLLDVLMILIKVKHLKIVHRYWISRSHGRTINIKTLINYGYFLKVINIKKGKTFPQDFHFRKNRNLVEKSVFAKQKSVLVRRKFIKNLKNILYNCIMLTFYVYILIWFWKLNSWENLNSFNYLINLYFRERCQSFRAKERWKIWRVNCLRLLLLLYFKCSLFKK